MNVSEVHVILDSTANVPPELLRNWANLHVVPLTVLLGDQQIAESELSAADLFRLIGETGKHPKTSQPAPGEFVQLFNKLCSAGHTVIVITLSGSLSGTVQSARTAVQMTGSKDIYVIDSGTTAIGMVRMAEFALTMASQGQSADWIVAQLQVIAEKTHTIFVPGTLEYLHKGGRIGGAAALFGAILQIRPVLYLEQGKVAVLDKVRTRSRAIVRMQEEIAKYSDLAYISVIHIEAQEEASAVQQQMSAKYPHIPVLLGNAGAVLASHLGPGLIGFIFQEKG